MGNDRFDEQELEYFNSLTGKAKRDYYVAIYISDVVFALKKRRKDEGLTQEEVANAMGVKQSYVSKMESLKKIPTLDTIARYSYALNFSVEDIEELSNEYAKIFNEKSIPIIFDYQMENANRVTQWYQNSGSKNDSTYNHKTSNGCSLKLAR